jgi:hypothetical protein
VPYSVVDSPQRRGGSSLRRVRTLADQPREVRICERPDTSHARPGGRLLPPQSHRRQNRAGGRRAAGPCFRGCDDLRCACCRCHAWGGGPRRRSGHVHRLGASIRLLLVTIVHSPITPGGEVRYRARRSYYQTAGSTSRVGGRHSLRRRGARGTGLLLLCPPPPLAAFVPPRSYT